MSPIRILHMTGSLGYGGVEVFIMNIYRNIDKNKVQFDFVVCEENGRFDNEVYELGGKIYRLPSRSRRPLSYFKELKKIFKANPQYKIFHCNTNSAGAFVDLLAAKQSVCKVRISHSHNSDCLLKLQHYMLKPFLKFVLTDKFACSIDAGKWMFGENKDVEIINNAIDISKFKYDRQLSLAVKQELGLQHKTVIGHVGSFQDRKNQTFLIDIMEKIDIDNSVLVLIGDGDNKEEIKRKVEWLGLNDKVLFLGNRNDVNRLMQAFDIFVFPSLFEGLPLVAIEAQASGLPCLVSNTIPLEVVLTDCTVSLPIDKGVELWIDRIYDFSKHIRKDESEKVVNAGYDINTQVKWLEDYYISKVNFDN